MIENRKFIRLKAPLPAEYCLIKKHKRQKTHATCVKNISVGGLSLVIKESVRQGDLMQIQIRVPLLQEPVRVTGDVVWHSAHHRDHSDAVLEAGVRFRDVNPAELNKILDYLYSVAIG